MILLRAGLLTLVALAPGMALAQHACHRPHHPCFHCAPAPRAELVEMVAVRRIAPPVRNELEFRMVAKPEAEKACAAAETAPPIPPAEATCEGIVQQLREIQRQLDNIKLLTLKNHESIEALKRHTSYPMPPMPPAR